MHDKLDRDNNKFPTSDNVEAELRNICVHIEHDDMILVHFSCHGLINEKGERVLVMQNSRQHVPKTFISLVEVETILKESKANRCILLLDACHVGLDMGRSLTDPAFVRNVFELAEGFAVIAASTSQQVSRERDDKQHGVFTYYLLEGLSKTVDHARKGFVTVDDLKKFVVDGLKDWNVEQSLCQEPNSRVEGIGDMIVADYRKG